MEIKAKKKDNEKVVVVNFDLPETLAELTEKFGEAAVASAAVDAITIGVQALVRRHFEKSQEEIQNIVNAHKPGVRTSPIKQTALEKATSALGAMSAEDRAELLNKLKAMQQAQKKAA